jgi:hypothetical protein
MTWAPGSSSHRTSISSPSASSSIDASLTRFHFGTSGETDAASTSETIHCRRRTSTSCPGSGEDAARILESLIDQFARYSYRSFGSGRHRRFAALLRAAPRGSKFSRPPSIGSQTLIRIAVAVAVGQYLRPPKFGISFWPCRVLRTPVPKTAVDEYGDAWAHKCNIGDSAWLVRNWNLKSIAKAERIELATERGLARGILLPDPLHAKTRFGSRRRYSGVIRSHSRMFLIRPTKQTVVRASPAGVPRCFRLWRVPSRLAPHCQ